MPIKTFPLYLLTAGEAAAAGRRMHEILSGVPQDDHHCIELRQMINKDTDAVEAAYNEPTASEFTGPILDWDGKRDSLLLQISRVLRGLSYGFEPTVAQAAEKLYNLFEKHAFGAANRSYEKQSTTVHAMFEDIESRDMQQAIVTTGLEQAFADLRTAQDEFDRLVLQRIKDETSEHREPILSELVKPLRQDLYDTLKYLASRERLHPEQYKTVVEQVNNLTSEITAKARARQTRNNGHDDQPEQSNS